MGRNRQTRIGNQKGVTYLNGESLSGVTVACLIKWYLSHGEEVNLSVLSIQGSILGLEFLSFSGDDSIETKFL